MSILGSTFDAPYGSAGDARAMTPDEILNYQISINAAIGQATFPDHYWRLQSNYRETQLTLDERFADFKVRLAAAIARRAKNSSFDAGMHPPHVEAPAQANSSPGPARAGAPLSARFS